MQNPRARTKHSPTCLRLKDEDGSITLWNQQLLVSGQGNFGHAHSMGAAWLSASPATTPSMTYNLLSEVGSIHRKAHTMANPEHLQMLQRVSEWNQWRHHGDGQTYLNDVRPDLTGASLAGKTFTGVYLAEVDFIGANLVHADFSHTVIAGANFS